MPEIHGMAGKFGIRTVEREKALKNIIHFIFVVLVWSSSPLLVKSVGLGIPAVPAAAVAVILAAALHALFFIYQMKQQGYDLANLRKDLLILRPKDWGALIGCALLGFVFYPICYFNALGTTGTTAIGSNIINYLWPVFLTLFQLRDPKRPATWWVLLGVTVSFFGAIVAIDGLSVLKYWQQTAAGRIEMARGFQENGMNPYINAAVGALCYAGYSFLFPMMSDQVRFGKLTGNCRILTKHGIFPLLLLVASIFHVIIVPIYLLSSKGSPLMGGGAISTCWLMLGIYAVLNMSVAHYLWARLLRQERMGAVSIPLGAGTFLIFVLGTLALVVTDPGKHPTPHLGYGVLCVLTGIYLATTKRGPGSFQSIVLGIILYYGARVYMETNAFGGGGQAGGLKPWPNWTLTTLECLTGLFAIFAGFFLQRVFLFSTASSEQFHTLLNSLELQSATATNTPRVRRLYARLTILIMASINDARVATRNGLKPGKSLEYNLCRTFNRRQTELGEDVRRNFQNWIQTTRPVGNNELVILILLTFAIFCILSRIERLDTTFEIVAAVFLGCTISVFSMISNSADRLSGNQILQAIDSLLASHKKSRDNMTDYYLTKAAAFRSAVQSQINQRIWIDRIFILLVISIVILSQKFQ